MEPDDPSSAAVPTCVDDLDEESGIVGDDRPLRSWKRRSTSMMSDGYGGK